MTMNRNQDQAHALRHSAFVTYQANVPLRAGKMRAVILGERSGASEFAQRTLEQIFGRNQHDALLETDRKSYELKSSF